ncbi:hypothetical protein GALMADRAFT_136216 [Galerina marginata CBS 339.88]|uniref:Uncharacterized protein n=1 Tax=Galerina marginata (strain CBS 339.88) TaxID=685588 RepID=A0A067TD84_GALM3|nr:hypothetical protein GALMADRAFT_136216 [Galerina marginata CBS 339.88]
MSHIPCRKTSVPSSSKPKPSSSPSVSATCRPAAKNRNGGEKLPQRSSQPYQLFRSTSAASVSPAERRERLTNESDQSVRPKPWDDYSPRRSGGHPYLRDGKRSSGGGDVSIQKKSYRGSDGEDGGCPPWTVGRQSSAGDRRSESKVESTRFTRSGRLCSKVKLYPGEAVDEPEYDDRERPEILGGHIAQFDTPYMPGSSSMNHARCLAWLRDIPPESPRNP